MCCSNLIVAKTKGFYLTNTDPANGFCRNLLPVAALLVGGVIATRPLVVFLNSSNDFLISFGDVGYYSLLCFALVFLVVMAVGGSLRYLRLVTIQRIFISATFTLGILLWLQGFFFIWDYGKLDGRPLDFSGHFFHGLVESALWTLGIAFSFLKHRSVLRWGRTMALFVLASLPATVAVAFVNSPRPLWYNSYSLVTDNYYTFSKNKNIVLLVIDSARGDIFTEIFESLGAEEKALFDGFTLFRNATGTFNSTNPAMSGTLTSLTYDFRDEKAASYEKMFISATSLPYRLKQAGFVTELYPYNNGSVALSPDVAENLRPIDTMEASVSAATKATEISKIWMVAHFNFSPHFLKVLQFDSSSMYAMAPPPNVSDETDRVPEVGVLEAELPERLQHHLANNRAVISGLKTRMGFRDEPVFKYLHFHGGHPPFFHDENMSGQVLPFSTDSYKRQFRGSLLLTASALIGSLRRAGVYEDTMLIIIGDHGLYLPDAERHEEALLAPIVDMLSPLVIIKPFGAISKPLTVSTAPVSLFDVPATVFDAVGIDEPLAGLSMFAVKPDEKRARYAYVLSGADSAAKGALKFKIDGDARRTTSWSSQRGFLQADIGEVILDPPEYEARLRNLLEFLNSTENVVRHWR